MESISISDNLGGIRNEKLKNPKMLSRLFFQKALPVLILAIFSWLIFGPFTVAEEPILRNYLVFPLLIWLAFKYTWRGMINALFLYSAIAIWNTWQGHGIFGFADQTRLENFVPLLVYLAVIIFSGLFLKTLISKQELAEESLRKSENKFRTVADFTYDWEYWIDQDDKILYMSPSCERISGYRLEEYLADSSLLEKIIHPEDLDLVRGQAVKLA